MGFQVPSLLGGFGVKASGLWYAVYHLEILNRDTRWGAHTRPGWFHPRHMWTHGMGSHSQILSPRSCFPSGICFAAHCITHPLDVFWILPLPSFHCNLFQLTLNDWVNGIRHPDPGGYWLFLHQWDKFIASLSCLCGTCFAFTFLSASAYTCIGTWLTASRRPTTK